MTPLVRACRVGFIVIAASLLAGCLFKMGPFASTAEEEVKQTFAVEQAPRVVVEMFNGGVEVIAGVEQGKVSARVTKRGSGATDEEAEADLENVTVALRKEGNTIYILASRREGAPQRGNSGASAVVEVPTGTELDLRSSNGGLNVRGLAGDVTGKTSNGSVKVNGSKGALKLTSSNGGITVEGGGNKLDLTTSNGAIKVTKARAATVSARTSNGSIHFDGALGEGEHVLHSSNGGVTVTLPADTHFRLDATTSNGRVTCDFPIKAEDQGKSHLRGTVGDEAATMLKLSSSNASIHVKRGE